MEGVKNRYKEHSQAERLKYFIKGAKPALRTTNQKTRTPNIPSWNFRMLRINRRSSNLCKQKWVTRGEMKLQVAVDLSEGSTGRQATVRWCSREHNIQLRMIPSQTIMCVCVCVCVCVIYKDSENLPFIYTTFLGKYLSYVPWLPSLSFQPHSPHSRLRPPFLKGEYQEVPWMPGVGSMPTPKSGIQPGLMGGRTKQNKLPRELTGFVTRKDQEDQRLQC